MGTPGTELAIMKRDVVDVVESKVNAFLEKGELNLPADYSPHNAMKSAWLILQNVETTDKKPVLTACTKNSIANALLDMVVQGLNPAKKQCYFIAYGKELVCQRSYFGTMAVAKNVDSTIFDIIAEVVYEGDTFKYKINRGKKEVTEHEQSLENIDKDKIVAAYCMVIDKSDNVMKTEIMTFDEIKQAWKQSKVKPINEKGDVTPSSTHGKFTAGMAIRTVINRACKPIINASSDSNLFLEHFNRADEAVAEHEVEQEIAENANTEEIDVEFEGVEDVEFDEGPEPELALEPEPEKPKDKKPTQTPTKAGQQAIVDEGEPDW